MVQFWYRPVFPCLVFFLGPSFAHELRSCPLATVDLVSVGEETRVEIELQTEVDQPLAVYFVDEFGDELESGSLVKGHAVQLLSHPGHVLRVYTGENSEQLLLEYTVTRDDRQDIKVLPCEPRDPPAVFASRALEFESLLLKADGTFPPCGPGRSETWSCTRRIPADICEARHRNDEAVTEGKIFGFSKSLQGFDKVWPPGAYEDHAFDDQMTRIPRLSNSFGFQMMNMTERLRTLLLTWYHERKDRAVIEDILPGGYLNENDAEFHLLDLFHDRQMQSAVIREMAHVLRWWTGQALRHTSTFGVRIYRRGAVLLNHVDRKDTHLASAVLQVAQTVDEDAGWPLEILSSSRECFEVYLQPGQMVLYEGARFKHGRPMRFQGDEFANVFTHFAPPAWNGPGVETFPEHVVEL